MGFRDDARGRGRDRAQGRTRSDGGRSGSGGRGRGPKLAAGAVGAVAVVVLALVFGVDPFGHSGGSGGGTARTMDDCDSDAGSDHNVECRIAAITESLDDVWTRVMPTAGVHYTRPTVTLFAGSVSTGGCGSATSDVGSFYCPDDETAYFDTNSFGMLERRFRASGATLAQEYVVAHEFGHHIQGLLGDPVRHRLDRPASASEAVRHELQADCYAGVWAHFAASTPAPESDRPLLTPVTENDLADALSAAAAINGDRIPGRSGTRVTGETWTHGSLTRREQSFMTGYDSGQVGACDTSAGTEPA